MINLNSILATFPEWGQKVPPLSLFGGRKARCEMMRKLFCVKKRTLLLIAGIGKEQAYE